MEEVAAIEVFTTTANLNSQMVIPGDINETAIGVNSDLDGSHRDSPPSYGGMFSTILQEFIDLLFTSPVKSASVMASIGGHMGDPNGGLLHFGTREYVLFSFWKVGSTVGMVGSVLMVFLIAVLHEAIIGLRFFLDREILLDASLPNSSPHSTHHSHESLMYVNDASQRNQGHPATSSPSSMENKNGAVARMMRHLRRRIFTRPRMLQALLYALQWTIFFIILLVVVTFNVWLILAAIWGKAAGYLLFIGSPALEKVERLSASVNAAGGSGGAGGGSRAEMFTMSEARRNLKSY